MGRKQRRTISELENVVRELNLSPANYISFSQYDVDTARHYAKKYIEAKKEEEVHKSDGNREYKRWTTGILGEVAVENTWESASEI